VSYRPPPSLYAFATESEDIELLIRLYVSPTQLRYFITEAQKVLDTHAAKDWASHRGDDNAQEDAI
jgi:hypothetical protein